MGVPISTAGRAKRYLTPAPPAMPPSRLLKPPENKRSVDESSTLLASSTEGRGTSVVAAAAAVAAERDGCADGKSLVVGVGGSEGGGLLEGVGCEGEGGAGGMVLLDLLVEAMGACFDAQEQVRSFFFSFFFKSHRCVCNMLCFEVCIFVPYRA